MARDEECMITDEPTDQQVRRILLSLDNLMGVHDTCDACAEQFYCQEKGRLLAIKFKWLVVLRKRREARGE